MKSNNIIPSNNFHTIAADSVDELVRSGIYHILSEDAGPIIDQEPVRICNNMNESDLRQAIIEVEQKMIYRAILSFLDGNLFMSGNGVIYKDYINVQNPE